MARGRLDRVADVKHYLGGSAAAASLAPVEDLQKLVRLDVVRVGLEREEDDAARRHEELVGLRQLAPRAQDSGLAHPRHPVARPYQALAPPLRHLLLGHPGLRAHAEREPPVRPSALEQEAEDILLAAERVGRERGGHALLDLELYLV